MHNTPGYLLVHTQHASPTTTFVLPVKDSRLILLSFAMASPISTPPHTVVQTAGGRLLAARTCWTMREMAMEVRGVEGAPFL